MDGTQTNGGSLSQISAALEATYDPRSSNDTRRAALQFLDDAKARPDAPSHGFTLASDKAQQPAVRHFGLSLLEFAVKYRWEDYNEEEARVLRDWVLSLAKDVDEADPLYFRNKIALLWTDIAKRCWGAEWVDMDQLLVTLWDAADESKGVAYKQMVLYILEWLSEDICNREDAVAGLRQDVLGQALNEIIIPENLYRAHLETRGKTQNVRCTQDGWLARVCAFVSACSPNVSQGDERAVKIVVKALDTLKAMVSWLSLQALIEARCVDSLYIMISCPNVATRTAAIEVLQAILVRPYNAHFHEPWEKIMRSVLQSDRIELLRVIHLSALTPADDIDEQQYTLLKKLSEVLSILGDAVAKNPQVAAGLDSMQALLDLMVVAFQNDSFLVSIPVLHSFSTMLTTTSSELSRAVGQRVSVLLGVSTQRLLRYESLLQESDFPVIAFLNEDFENLPELHAFLGNYRRYCITIIESITRSLPEEAVTYILEQTAQLVSSTCQQWQAPFANTTSSKTPLPVLELEAQASVLRSTLAGFSQWLSKLSRLEPGDPSLTAAKGAYRSIDSHLQEFCAKLMSIRPEHPDVARISIHMLVNVLVKSIQGQPELVVKVLDYIMNLRFAEYASNKDYTEAKSGFSGARVNEMQRIAFAFPDYLLDVYADLELRVSALLNVDPADDRLKWGLQSFLFIIIHRASAIEQGVRVARLEAILQPIALAWQDPALTQALDSFSGFCGLVGLEGLPEYLVSRNYASVQDWANEPLDEAGKNKQTEIRQRSFQLPLNPTQKLMGATTEKLKDGSRDYQIAGQLWGATLQAMLPNLLKMIKYATAFSDLSNWTSLPLELQSVIRRMMVDRFWQAGISNESRDEFYARISESGSTYEGFASSIRGTPRTIRDWAYQILYGMSRFQDEFYGLTELPAPLADALLANASSLSSHHLQRLIGLVEKLVHHCPVQCRRQFLPPLLTLFFRNVDQKITQEWESIEQARQAQTAEEDQLGDEMKTESIIRSTTYSVVSFASSLLDQRQPDIAQSDTPDSAAHTTRVLVLSDPSLLEPLILFCTHTLRMRDSRCCTLMCRVLRSMIPVFNGAAAPAPQVREFISTEVLKACITSLNEPYFVDVQRDLASLIANVIHLYSDKTVTPRCVLASLPDMPAAKVEKAVRRIVGSDSEKAQRALVLDLLEGVRGVSIHEAGKIDRASGKAKRSAMQQRFMEVERQPEGGIERGGSPGLDGMAGLFGDA